MTAKHSPGPWRVCADGVSVGPDDGFMPFDGCGCCGSPWMNAEDDDVALADARLIAKAPELLEALQRYVSVIACGGGGDRDLFMAAIREADDAARAVIAAATGDAS